MAKTVINKRLIFALLFAFVILVAHGQQPEFHFERYSVSDGLPSGVVKAIYQDHLGFIWIGTESGLARYDGYEFQNFNSDLHDPHSLSGNAVYAICEDANNDLLIATNKGLNIFNRDFENFSLIPHHQAYENNRLFLRGMYMDTDSSFLLFGGSPGLFQYTPTDKKIRDYAIGQPYFDTLSIENVTSAIRSKDNRLWIATGENGVFVLDEQQQKVSYLKNSDQADIKISSSEIWQLYEHADSTVWISTHNGLNVYYPENDSVVAMFSAGGNGNYLTSSYVFGVFPATNGNLWIGTTGGLDLYNPTTKVFYHYTNSNDNPNSISDNSSICIYYDKQENLWVGTAYGGVNLSKAKHLLEFKSAKPIPDNFYNQPSIRVGDIMVDREDNLWVGIDGGGLNRSKHYVTKSTKFTNINLPKLTYTSVLSLAQASDGDIWFGGYKQGLRKLNPATNQLVEYKHDPNNPHSLASDDVRDLLILDNGQLWIATNGGGLCIFDEEKAQFKRITSSDGLSTDWCTSLFQDSRGDVWAASYYGVTQINPVSLEKNIFVETATPDCMDCSISNNWVYCTNETSDGSLWFGTNNGLNRFNPDQKTFQVYTTSDGLSDNTVYGILEDADHNLWISTKRGLSCFRVKEEVFVNYEKDGLQSKEFMPNSCFKHKDGTLYFGNSTGYTYFKPKDIQSNPFKVNTYIYDLQLKYKSVKTQTEGSPLTTAIGNTKSLTLNWEESKIITFKYVGLNYFNIPKTEYAYMLKGFDKKWNFVGTERKATYTNLNPGHYTFMVKAANDAGLWNDEPTTLVLHITPPFWKTNWFRVLGVLLGLGLVGAIVHFRTVEMKRRQMALEKMVKVRTAEIAEQRDEILSKKTELEKQKEEISEQSELLSKTNRQLSIKNEMINGSIRYAETIQKATLPTINKLEQLFDSFVVYKPKDIVSGDFYWLYTHDKGMQDETTYVVVADCTGHGVPGALLSMIGISLLNEIVRQLNILNPAQILAKLNVLMEKQLKQKQTMNRDGMDVGLCAISKVGQKYKVVFAGAKSPVFVYSTNSKELSRVVGTRKPIGGARTYKTPVEYQNTGLELEAGDVLYLLSDGYQDQKGYDDTKFGRVRLMKLLNEIATEPMPQQGEKMKAALAEFQQNEIQRDDITVVGIKLRP